MGNACYTMRRRRGDEAANSNENSKTKPATGTAAPGPALRTIAKKASGADDGGKTTIPQKPRARRTPPASSYTP